MCADQHARTEAIAVFKYMQMSNAAGLTPDAQSYEHLIGTAVGVNDMQFVMDMKSAQEKLKSRSAIPSIQTDSVCRLQPPVCMLKP